MGGWMIPSGNKLSLASCCKLELARFSILLRIQDRTKVFRHRGANRGGDTAHQNRLPVQIGEQLGWGHRTTFKEKIYMVGWVDGWVDGVFLEEI